MMKFYRWSSIACASLGSIGFGVLLYLCAVKSDFLMESLFPDVLGVDMYLTLLAGSFVNVLCCAVLHSFYLQAKRTRQHYRLY